MRHVVVLVGSYYPRFSAVGKCADSVIRVLKSEARVSVVCLHDGSELPDVEEHEGVRIVRISTPKQVRRAAIVRRLRETGSVLWRGMLGLDRLRGAATRLLSRRTVDDRMAAAYLDAASRLGRIDVLIPVVFPIETVPAALALKRASPEMVLIPYLFDDFVESPNLHVLAINRALKRSAHLRLEREMLQASTAVLAMHQLTEHFQRSHSTEVRQHLRFVEHPLLSRPRVALSDLSRGPIRITFTGSLIKGVREPDYLLELARRMSPRSAVEFHFYTMGNCDAAIEAFKSRPEVQVFSHGSINSAQAEEKLADSHVLLNIGERRGRQLSSKIFEYMAIGRPIVHLSYVEGDVVTRVLSKYPLHVSVLMDGDRIEHNAAKVTRFIEEHRDSMLPFDQVKGLYPEALPQTTAELFSSLINSAAGSGKHFPIGLQDARQGKK